MLLWTLNTGNQGRKRHVFILLETLQSVTVHCTSCQKEWNLKYTSSNWFAKETYFIALIKGRRSLQKCEVSYLFFISLFNFKFFFFSHLNRKHEIFVAFELFLQLRSTAFLEYYPRNFVSFRLVKPWKIQKNFRIIWFDVLGIFLSYLILKNKLPNNLVW